MAGGRAQRKKAAGPPLWTKSNCWMSRGAVLLPATLPDSSRSRAPPGSQWWTRTSPLGLSGIGICMMMTPGRTCISGCEVPQTTVWADVCRVGVAARRMPRPEPTPVVSGSLVWGPWKRLRILHAGGRGEELRPWNHLGNSRSAGLSIRTVSGPQSSISCSPGAERLPA